MKTKRISAWLWAPLLLCLLLWAAAPLPMAAAEVGGVTVESLEDWNALAARCTLDTWSQGKTVRLLCDLDFQDADFVPIPTFGGVFQGNGHVLSGISCAKSGSYLGVFRYIQQGGSVTGLRVEGSLIPGGSKSYVGGIAGENAGVISQCAFQGTVKGENVVGGIAGANTDSGQILSCTAAGTVTGENATGGIAGKSSGFLSGCENQAQVNTVYEEKENNLAQGLDADAGAIVERYQEEQAEHEEDSVLGHTDTGGVVGSNTGVVQGCTNQAQVGYPHIGYNVGGVAGRQSGYLLGCQNNGLIQGRKDVGGIVGQAEPYILLSVSEEDLGDLQEEFDRLRAMMDSMLADTDGLEQDTQLRFDKISGYAETARENAGEMLRQGTDFVDDNLGEINAQAATLSNTLKRLSPLLTQMEEGGDDAERALEKAETALKELDIAMPQFQDEASQIRQALQEISSAQESTSKAASHARRAIDDLEDAVVLRSQAQVRSALSALTAAFQEIQRAKETTRAAVEAIETILRERPEGLAGLGVNIEKLRENLALIRENLTASEKAIQTVTESLDALLNNTELHFSEFRTAAEHMQDAVTGLNQAIRTIGQGLTDLGLAIESAAGELDAFTADADTELGQARQTLAQAMDDLSGAVDGIGGAAGECGQILADLAQEDSLQFVKLGDGFRESSDQLLNALSGISDELSRLGDSAQDELNQFETTVTDKKKQLTQDLTAINAQFDRILQLMMGKLENWEGTVTPPSEIFLDVSDQDIEGTKQGKVAQCQNQGQVEADRNTGGIAGAMAIEYAKDPEDDLEKPATLRFAYQTKDILQRCVNQGKVTGKKDCTGGLVGLGEIGTVYQCESYGDIVSADGSYVGGIAGESEASIRSSYAKGTLSGQRYVGGIAGKGAALSGCYAIVNITGTENTGALCGGAEALDSLKQNFYVDHGLGAVDGVSYQGRGEPISFDALAGLAGIPAKLVSFTVTFLADGKAVETQEVRYGAPTGEIVCPAIPEKEGEFGTWPAWETPTVTGDMEVNCLYRPYITLLASDQRNESGKLALALAEGNFTDRAELSVTPGNAPPPAEARADAQGQVYDIALRNTSLAPEDSLTLRFLNENRERLTVWRRKGETWEKVKPASRGKYVVLALEGPDNTIYVQRQASRAPAAAAAALGLGAAAGLAVLLGKRRKKRKQHSD